MKYKKNSNERNIDMFYQLFPLYLQEDFYSYWHNFSEEKISDNFVSCVMGYFSKVEKVLEAIDEEKSNISNQEFINRIEKMFSISLNDKQYLKMFSTIVKKEFVKYGELLTNIYFKDQKTEGHGKDFSWWIENYRLVLNVIQTKDADIDYNRLYSNDEIEELIKKQEIIVVGERGEKCEEKIQTINEKSKNFESYIIPKNDYGLSFDETSKYYPFVLQYIRENIDIQYVKKYAKLYLIELNQGVKECLKNRDDSYDSEYYNNIANMCSEKLTKLEYSKKMSKIVGN